jgi:hypothetical protein
MASVGIRSIRNFNQHVSLSKINALRCITAMPIPASKVNKIDVTDGEIEIDHPDRE